jgi:hypothetical protein
VSAPDILANMSRGWNRDPMHIALGSERTPLATALWTHNNDDVQEVWAEAHALRHIVWIPQVGFGAEVLLDERLAWGKQIPASSCGLVPAGVRPRAVHVGRFSVLHLYMPVNLVVDIVRVEGLAQTEGAVELVDPACTADPMIERIGREVLVEMRELQKSAAGRRHGYSQDIRLETKAAVR